MEKVTKVVFEFGLTKLTCIPGRWLDYWDCQTQVGALELPLVVGLFVPGGLGVHVAIGIVCSHLERFTTKPKNE